MDLDVTFFVQLVIIVCVLLVGTRLLFRPFIRTIAQREARIEGVRSEAALITAEADALRKAHQQQVDVFRQQTHRARDERLAALGEGSDVLLCDAQQHHAQQLSEGLTALAEEHTRCLKHLNRKRPHLAAELAAHLLRRELS